MKPITYFHINNIKFNYALEFQSNEKNDYWKHNAPLIEYCETIGVNIPHYCYHKSLSISGNCRMCLVELKNSPKPIVSCAMSARSCLNNSEIFTNSPLVKKARENVLEFLLLNHPLDCPICDQGGECDLQDQSLYFGITKKRFYNFKRVVTDKNIGPIVKTVMTRCIHCTRCVRFAAEVAGTEDLGMFGRGLDSEIGTYVAKTFQSELSGNIIDLCPVGALTSKPYPFVSRSWELKGVNSFDFSDGFGTPIQIYLKNNTIIKINPDYDVESNSLNWISDKTRFAFDGMFSPERILSGFLKTGREHFKFVNSWKILLDEIITTLYFHDHLNKHFLTTKNLYIVFDSNISLEVVNLLCMFAKKYSFIKLRHSEDNAINNDSEKSFMSGNSSEIAKDLNESNLGILIGLDSRYESPSLNIKLRKRFLSGDFKVISLGSSLDLTFPTSYLGFNVKNLQAIAEGNNSLCQQIANSKTTFFIGSSILKRNDNITLLNLLKIIKKNCKNINFHVINSVINETGIKYLQKFKSINSEDINNNSNGLYFLNTASQSANVKKIINIQLLNYFENKTSVPKFCFDQNNGVTNNAFSFIKSPYQIYNYINIPNNCFFEANGTYLNTEGALKKNIKFISTNNQTKSDWLILRKIFMSLGNLNFLNNCNDSAYLPFNGKSLNKYQKFTGFLSFPNKNVTNKCSLKSMCKVSIEPINLLKQQKNRIYYNKVKLWLRDFYIGGKDPYSKHSCTMIKCSKSFRDNKHIFTHLN